MRMDEMKDPMGRAIADYWKNGKAGRLRVFSPMFDEDEIPVDLLFRQHEEMSEMEQKALLLAKGKILDVGAGAGCHSLHLQEAGHEVTAVDISPLSVDVMRKRGVRQVLHQDFFSLEGAYDTVLMLMNGMGIVGTLERIPEFFQHLDKILLPEGQLLCDSSDIAYVFEDDEGIIELPDASAYYGELTYRMQYKNIVGKSFPWLYVDAETLAEQAERCGYAMEVVFQGEHYDYLARITKKKK